MSLAGARVIVTRPAGHERDLADLLRAAGAEPVVVAVLGLAAPSDGGEALRDAVDRIRDYSWIVVTSANGVDALFGLGPDMAGAQIAAVGDATAAAVHGYGEEVALVPEAFVAESLVEVFPMGSGRVLVAQAAGARRVVAEGIRAKGWIVDAIDAYRTVEMAPDEAAREGAAGADAVTFTSASAVRAYVAFGLPVPPVVACIGPVTAAEATAAGLRVDAIADPSTLDGLVAALFAAYA